ncbi:MAG: type II toxin-antitoxin system PemK/MazF family toxin [Synergistaceae bacterium]|nr:type II toxin-antitoxin system PemK/MazF family toxin [Synergistaceae bacterium]
MRNYKQGEIVEIAFPFEEKNEKKVRPALIIKDFGDSLFVIKITSKHKGREWDIEIPKDDFNGLTLDSVIQVNQYIELEKSEISCIVPRGVINPLQLAVVKDRLKQFMLKT